MQAFIIVILFTINSVMHGYHVYKDIWKSAHGEEMQCQCEASNVHGLYTVSIMQYETIMDTFHGKFLPFVAY